METVVAVCNIYELTKRSGKFIDFKKDKGLLLRSEILLEREYINEKNESCYRNGIWHEVNEDLTVEYFENGAKLKSKREKAKVKAKKLTEVLTNVLETADEINSEEEDVDLNELRESFKLKFEKDVPVNKKNDKNWILNKLK